MTLEEEEILAANATYEPNRVRKFTVTPEGAKYGITELNGAVAHVQAEHGQPYRNPETNKNIAKLFQEEFAPNEQLDYNDPQQVQNFVSKHWATNKDKIPEVYAKRGLIKGEEAPTEKPTVEQLAQKAADTGKSFLQIYQENFPKPEYEAERANDIQSSKKASILSDIIKLIGEGVTTNKGGTPIRRESMAPALNAELQKLNDLYKSEMRTYKQNGFQYLMADEQEKRRQAAIKSARELALLDKSEQRAYDYGKFKTTLERNDKKDQQSANFKERELALRKEAIRVSASKGSGKSGTDKEDTEKNMHILINGKSTKVPVSYVNDVASRTLAESTEVQDPKFNMKPEQLFAMSWKKYYDYKNGEFVPKQMYQLKEGEFRKDGKVYKTVPKATQTAPKQKAAQPNPVSNKFVPSNDPLGLGL